MITIRIAFVLFVVTSIPSFASEAPTRRTSKNNSPKCDVGVPSPAGEAEKLNEELTTEVLEATLGRQRRGHNEAGTSETDKLRNAIYTQDKKRIRALIDGVDHLMINSPPDSLTLEEGQELVRLFQHDELRDKGAFPYKLMEKIKKGFVLRNKKDGKESTDMSAFILFLTQKAKSKVANPSFLGSLVHDDLEKSTNRLALMFYLSAASEDPISKNRLPSSIMASLTRPETTREGGNTLINRLVRFVQARGEKTDSRGDFEKNTWSHAVQFLIRSASEEQKTDLLSRALERTVSGNKSEKVRNANSETAIWMFMYTDAAIDIDIIWKKFGGPQGNPLFLEVITTPPGKSLLDAALRLAGDADAPKGQQVRSRQLITKFLNFADDGAKRDPKNWAKILAQLDEHGATLFERLLEAIKEISVQKEDGLRSPVDLEKKLTSIFSKLSLDQRASLLRPLLGPSKVRYFEPTGFVSNFLDSMADERTKLDKQEPAKKGSKPPISRKWDQRLMQTDPEGSTLFEWMVQFARSAGPVQSTKLAEVVGKLPLDQRGFLVAKAVATAKKHPDDSTTKSLLTWMDKNAVMTEDPEKKSANAAAARNVSPGPENLGRDLLNYQDRDGKTPLHLALENFRDVYRRPKTTGADMKNALDVVNTLLEGGASPNIPDKKGYAPVHLIAQIGDLELVRIFAKPAYKTNFNLKGGPIFGKSSKMTNIFGKSARQMMNKEQRLVLRGIENENRDNTPPSQDQLQTQLRTNSAQSTPKTQHPQQAIVKMKRQLAGPGQLNIRRNPQDETRIEQDAYESQDSLSRSEKERQDAQRTRRQDRRARNPALEE